MEWIDEVDNQACNEDFLLVQSQLYTFFFFLIMYAFHDSQ